MEFLASLIIHIVNKIERKKMHMLCEYICIYNIILYIQITTYIARNHNVARNKINNFLGLDIYFM